MTRSHTGIAAAAALGALALVLAPAPRAAFAQDLFVTGNRTVAGGNPVNGAYSRIVIGADAANGAFPGVAADITGGSASQFVAAVNASLVNISGGTFGTAPTGFTYASALSVQGGSTVNLSGGTFNSFAFVGPFFGTGPTSTLNISGGTITDVYARTNSVVNMTGGSITALPGNAVTGGVLRNDSNATINLSGGTVDVVQLSFYGTAQSGYSTTNISGGTVGSITADGNGFLNFLGSGLTVNAGAQYAVYNPFAQAIYFVRDYTVGGTLSSGDVLSESFTGGADYTASGTSVQLRGSGTTLAPDLFVQSDQVVNGIHSRVTVGYDEDFAIPSSPNVTVADGANVAGVDLYNASSVLMTGGTVHAYAGLGGTSQLTVTGGSIGNSGDPDTGIIAFENSRVVVSGGTVNNVHGFDDSQVLISGSARVAIADINCTSFVIAGGSVQTVMIGASFADTGVLTLLGGSVEAVEGYGGTAEIRGGLAQNAVLAYIGLAAGYTGVDFNLYGTDLAFGNPTDGTYSSGFSGDFAGIWWDLSGTLEDGSLLSARYFDADGTTAGPTGLRFAATASVPEPGTLALALVGLGGLCLARGGRGLRRPR